ncbi:molybdopterin-binding oxidoreductase [Brevundimonas goettingensis]|uniref:molybdopterin-binding oxidoreductase n=1 Tax=Brevundimonas goettingensis TaxID=2774190 RepID=UPI001CED5E0E|nr:molybdopterin-binding oxidoreductase [Brevundimonas goettingensis]
MSHRAPILALVAACFALAGPAAAQSVALRGADGGVTTLEAPELAALPRVSIPLTIYGEAHVFEGPLLIDVLTATGIQTGAALRGPALAQAVVVRAADGYAVVFGLAELDPGTRPNRIILADTVDGAPLKAGDGPFRLVAEGDLRPARSVRQVTAVEVVRLSTSGTHP